MASTGNTGVDRNDMTATAAMNRRTFEFWMRNGRQRMIVSSADTAAGVEEGKHYAMKHLTLIFSGAPESS